MNEMEYGRELMAYNEKIALAELETAKAKERVRELEYERARFQLEWMNGKILEVMKQRPAQSSGQSPA